MYTEFFFENWFLFLGLIAIIGILLFDPTGSRSSAARAISPMELSRLVNHEQALMIDVRSKDQFSKGHIPKSKNFSLDDFATKGKRLEKFKKRPLVIICQTGQTANKAAIQLRKLGFDRLFKLAGGLNEWQKDNLPLEKT